MKAVIYARQSSGAEEESASIEQQIINCQKLAAEKKLEVIGVYSDANRSGKTYPALPEALEMLKKDAEYKSVVGSFSGTKKNRPRTGLAEAIKLFDDVDYIILDDKTRLYRPVSGSYLDSYILQIFKKYNVKIYSCKEGIIDFQKWNDFFILDLENKINDQQIKKHRQKSMQQLQALRDTGYRVTGSDFYGYKYIANQKVEIDEIEKIIVQKAFELFVSGESYTQVCIKINAEFGTIIKYQGLIKILKRPEYAGYCYNSKNELIESKVIPAIIPLSTFFEAKKRLENKIIHTNRDKKNNYVCTGLVYCGTCGAKMGVYSADPMPNSKETNRLHYFKCNSLKYNPNHKKECTLSNIRYNYDTDLCGLHEALLPLVIKQFFAYVKCFQNNKNNKKEEEKIDLRIEKLERFAKELDDMRLEELITFEEYKEKVKKINEELKSLKDTKIKLSSVNDDDNKKLHDMIVVALGDIKHHKIDDVLYKKLLAEVIEKIIVYPYSINVIFKDGTKLELERIPERNTRVLPSWTIVTDDIDNFGIDSKIKIYYQYKSFFTAETNDLDSTLIYSADGLSIYTIGDNPEPYSYLKKRNQHKRLARASKRIASL